MIKKTEKERSILKGDDNCSIQNKYVKNDIKRNT